MAVTRKRLARRIAMTYRNRLKAEANIFVKPFSDSIPVEEQSVFTHFLKAADILIEENRTSHLDVRAFVKAQFIGMKFSGHPPYPGQLYSTGARLRFAEYLNKAYSDEASIPTEDDFFVNEYEVQERKLKRMCDALNLDEVSVLRSFGSKFTKAFVKSKGVRR